MLSLPGICPGGFMQQGLLPIAAIITTQYIINTTYYYCQCYLLLHQYNNNTTPLLHIATVVLGLILHNTTVVLGSILHNTTVVLGSILRITQGLYFVVLIPILRNTNWGNLQMSRGNRNCQTCQLDSKWLGGPVTWPGLRVEEPSYSKWLPGQTCKPLSTQKQAETRQ